MRLPFAREGLPFVAALAVLAAVGGVWRGWAAVPPLAAAVFVLWFFRDPERTAPADPRAVLSPADGKVIRAHEGRLSVFLNLFDVHVCRAPVAGRLVSVDHIPGRFMAAFKDQASEHNERSILALRTPAALVRCTLVAGLVARRIIHWVRAGEDLAAGQRVGLIRFGSRVDVDLPEGSQLQVKPGDRVVAGESIVARLPSTPGHGSGDSFSV